MASSVAPLAGPIERFVLHWGEMGTRWGISRAVAQIHALLIVSETPLTADDIAVKLNLARSTVSTSLKELQTWELVRVQHVLGDRRDHFETVGDVWAMAFKIAEIRKRRELDPTVGVLRECMGQLDGPDNAHAKAQLTDLVEIVEVASALYDQTTRLSEGTLRRMAKGAGLLRLAGGAAG